MSSPALPERDFFEWCRDEICQALLDVAFMEDGGRYIIKSERLGVRDVTQHEISTRRRNIEVLRDFLASYGLSEVPEDLKHGGKYVPPR
jgi:hypothetical protein